MNRLRRPQILFHNTNDRSRKVTFQQALMEGQPPDCNGKRGLYMVDRKDVPKLEPAQIRGMKRMNYPEIATTVLTPWLQHEIAPSKIEELMNRAYDPALITVEIQQIMGFKAYIMWLTKGPTYSFKDYAGRFYGVVLDHFLGTSGGKKTILIATSGDTGPALAHALHGLENVDVVIFYPKAKDPKGAISDGQRRQMTTLNGNVHAIAVNGTFDVCQELVTYLLNNKKFAKDVFDDPERFSSANSISLGRLLPQMVYPFFAHSRIATGMEPLIASIPSGNFGDMLGTVLAREMGLPVSRIICALNENIGFVDYLESGRYTARATVNSLSSAMNVGHPNNLARLVDFYGGHMFDKVGPDGKVVEKGIIDAVPDIEAMRRDIRAIAITDSETYFAMSRAFHGYDIVLDPHGAVGYHALAKYLECYPNPKEVLSVTYETADPGKFPVTVENVTRVKPPIPAGMQKQASMPERIEDMESKPDEKVIEGDKTIKVLSDKQIREAKGILHMIFNDKSLF